MEPVKQLLFALLGIALWGAPVHSQDKPAGADSLDSSPVYILANTKGASIGKSLSKYCLNEDSTYVREGEVILIIGTTVCTRSQYSEPEKFYKVAYRGNAYYAKQSDVVISDEHSKKLNSVTDWTQIETFSIEATAYLRDKELTAALDDIRSKAKHGIALLDWGVTDESEYTDGTGLSFKLLNSGKRTIKYIWFTVQGYNPVGDRVGAPRTVKGVGPIKPDDGASYSFDYVWHTDLVETAKFRQIKIQYMDGKFKTISGNFDALFLDDETIDVLEE